jgi:hypothetical protein
VAERRDVDDVRVSRVHFDTADLLRVAEPHEVPGPAGVGRAIQAPALRDVRTHVGLSGADVDHAGIRSGDGERADRAHRHVVEDRLPGAAGVEALPDATVHRAEVVMVGLAGHTRDREHAPAAERPDEPPAQVLKQ